jgi:4-diphosphocytidyl-2-C-methyl-D-erythritol kinase
MIVFPNCKINLGLYISAKRPDGYHNLETVFYPLALREPLEIVESTSTQIHISGKEISGIAADNLIMKAYHLLKTHFPHKVMDYAIYLHKVLPMGAGLGGGSSDAAFMLMLINRHAALGLNDAQLAQYALQLGSDCPFFIYNRPMLAKGRGEQLEPIALDLSAYAIHLICPKLHIATADAFKKVIPRPAPVNLAILPTIPISQWRELLSNDFESPLFALHPVLNQIKQALYNAGALYAAMSGSGSSLYGIFPKGTKASISTPIQAEQFYLEELKPGGHL